MTPDPARKLCVIQWHRELLLCIKAKRPYSMIPLQGESVQFQLL